MKLSLVIPCYNEESTLANLLVEVLKLKGKSSIDLELLIVDDYSRDGSRAVAASLAKEHPEVRVLCHAENQGKGAALRTGFAEATGDFVGVQDADLEYEPSDYLKMVDYAERTGSDVVFGSRYRACPEGRALRWWHTMMNRFLTFVSNAFSDLAITDMETCYKMFRRETLQRIVPLLHENRFGFEPEITAHVAHLMRFEGIKVGEVAISYRPRTFAEGKKIGWKDGVRALWCILKYNAPVMPIPVQVLIYASAFAVFFTVVMAIINFIFLIRYC